MHGGNSTGPGTPQGLARSKRANWKHEMYSAEAKAEARRLRDLLSQGRALWAFQRRPSKRYFAMRMCQRQTLTTSRAQPMTLG